MPSESIISCTNIFFYYKNKQTDVHKNSCKKRFACFIYCGANFEFWLKQGEGGTFFKKGFIWREVQIQVLSEQK